VYDENIKFFIRSRNDKLICSFIHSTDSGTIKRDQFDCKN